MVAEVALQKTESHAISLECQLHLLFSDYEKNIYIIVRDVHCSELLNI